jgi:hypothetical protein
MGYLLPGTVFSTEQKHHDQNHACLTIYFQYRFPSVDPKFCLLEQVTRVQGIQADTILLEIRNNHRLMTDYTYL